MQELFIVRVLTEDGRLEHVPATIDNRIYCAGNYRTYDDALSAIGNYVRDGGAVDDERLVILSAVKGETSQTIEQQISRQVNVIRKYVSEEGQGTGIVSGQMVLSALDVIMELTSDREKRSKRLHVEESVSPIASTILYSTPRGAGA